MASPAAGTKKIVSSRRPFGKARNDYSKTEWAAFYKLKTMSPAGRRAFIKATAKSSKASGEWKAAVGQVGKDNPLWLRDKPGRSRYRRDKGMYDAARRCGHGN